MEGRTSSVTMSQKVPFRSGASVPPLLSVIRRTRGVAPTGASAERAARTALCGEMPASTVSALTAAQPAGSGRSSSRIRSACRRNNSAPTKKVTTRRSPTRAICPRVTGAASTAPSGGRVGGVPAGAVSDVMAPSCQSSRLRFSHEHSVCTNLSFRRVAARPPTRPPAPPYRARCSGTRPSTRRSERRPSGT